jgi:hypothetical protein
MASNTKNNKPAVKSTARKSGKIGWSQGNKNANTLKKIQKANHEEDVFKAIGSDFDVFKRLTNILKPE